MFVDQEGLRFFEYGYKIEPPTHGEVERITRATQAVNDASYHPFSQIPTRPCLAVRADYQSFNVLETRGYFKIGHWWRRDGNGHWTRRHGKDIWGLGRRCLELWGWGFPRSAIGINEMPNWYTKPNQNMLVLHPQLPVLGRELTSCCGAYGIKETNSIPSWHNRFNQIDEKRYAIFFEELENENWSQSLRALGFFSIITLDKCRLWLKMPIKDGWESRFVITSRVRDRAGYYPNQEEFYPAAVRNKTYGQL